MSHARGPWKFLPIEDGRRSGFLIVDADGLPLMPQVPREGNEANVFLVAAAPSLLDSLKRCVANHCGNEKLFCSTCTDARKAIKKAEEGI